jgi:anti-anti-sigma regulatory factor
MRNFIPIKKRFLIFRDEAKEIEKMTKKRSRDNVYLDFSNVDFLSRSFADELLNIIEEKRRIKIVNLKPHLEKFFKIVTKTKEKTKKSIEKW